MMISRDQFNEKIPRKVDACTLAVLDAEHMRLKALLDENRKEYAKMRGPIMSIEHLPNETLANIFKFAAVLPYARVGAVRGLAG
jgi:ATP-dependent Zn protease